MSKLYQKNPLIFVSILLVGLLFSCTARKKADISSEEVSAAEASREGGRTLAVLRERGAIKVGMSLFNPWAMQDINGEWIGFEIDVAQKLADDSGLVLELVPTAWEGIIPALLVDKFDIIIGGMSVTPERAEQVTFSAPYEYSKTVLLLNQKVSVSSIEELNHKQYRFVGRAGSTPFALAQQLFPEAQAKSFKDDGLAMQDLINGQADAFVSTAIEAAWAVADYPKILYVPEWGWELKKEDVAFALPKNVEAAWLDYINQWIQQNWDNGFLAEKSRYWFESLDWTEDHQLP